MTQSHTSHTCKDGAAADRVGHVLVDPGLAAAERHLGGHPAGRPARRRVRRLSAPRLAAAAGRHHLRDKNIRRKVSRTKKHALPKTVKNGDKERRDKRYLVSDSG